MNTGKCLIQKIDKMTYTQMLSMWRFSEVGNPMLSGEIGEYFKQVMNEKRSECDHVKVSKSIGW